MSWSNYKILFIIWEYQISRVDTVKKSKADHLGLEHNLHSDKLDILNLNDGLPDERYRRQKNNIINRLLELATNKQEYVKLLPDMACILFACSQTSWITINDIIPTREHISIKNLKYQNKRVLEVCISYENNIIKEGCFSS